MTATQQTALRAVLAKVPTSFLIDEVVKREQFVKARLRCEDRHCARCDKQAAWDGCDQCREIIRAYQRNKYRARKRIPLDAPRYNVTP